MSFLFHEPFEPALFVRDRPFAPPPAGTPAASSSFSSGRRATAQLIASDAFDEAFEGWPWRRRGYAKGQTAATPGTSSFNPARRRIADAFFEPEPAEQRRRRFVQGHANAPTGAGATFSPVRRIMASLAAFAEDPWPFDSRRYGGTGYTIPNGTTASFSLSFTGQNPDPWGDEGLSAGAGFGLAADSDQALATQRLADFTGVSASRTG